MTDARFEDAGDGPLRLKAETGDDIPILSALLQDAVLPASEISWQPRRHCFAALLNRFRWEDSAAAAREGRAFERVQAMLVIDGALAVAANGIDPGDRDLLFSVLSLSFAPDGAGGGRLVFLLSGDGEIAVDVECLDVTLKDVTRPYAAPSGKAPEHEPE